VSARPLLMPINPALLKHADQRRQHLENRIADQITRFAGAMLFVYLHIGVCVHTASNLPATKPHIATASAESLHYDLCAEQH
jgi:hypothetical protein